MPGFGAGPSSMASPSPPGNRAVPDPRSPLGERLTQISTGDPSFDPPKF